jgi:hypothetical protein
LKQLWKEVIRGCQQKQSEAKADEIAQAVASHVGGNNSLPVGVTIGPLLLGCSVISVFIIYMLILLLMPSAGLHFCV